MPLSFDHQAVRSIEAALDAARPQGWRRARERDIQGLPGLDFMAAWRVDLPHDCHLHPLVTYCLVGIDERFPLSEPRVWAPQAAAPRAEPWPHVEGEGRLCLGTTRFSADAGDRILRALDDALKLLNSDEPTRQEEFEREFLAYWSHRRTTPLINAICMVEPRPESRDIVYWRTSNKILVFAETQEQLRAWAKNRDPKAPDTFPTTRLTWLARAWQPVDYPKRGRDVLARIDAQELTRHVSPGASLPLLFACAVDGEALFAGVEIHGASASLLQRGFRPSRRPPARNVLQSFHAKEASRFPVHRADAEWVHGRGHNAELSELRERCVAVVGCGALGSFVAHQLAQAGVGRLLLIDPDELRPTNVGRHALGMSWVMVNKATALAAQIKRDFPHIRAVEAFPRSFEALKASDLEALRQCDLILLAGIDLGGELAVDAWRSRLATPPPMVWSFIEEFAVAGHAVAITGLARLKDGLDRDARFLQRVTTQWPPGEALRREAGCGVMFQPYSTVDMMGTVTVTTRLCLDLLLARVDHSVTRTWLGSRTLAQAHGATLHAVFDTSNCEIERTWLG